MSVLGVVRYESDQACRRCGGIGQFMVRCPQLQGRSRGEFRGSTSGGRGVTGRSYTSVRHRCVLHIGPFQANNLSGQGECDIRERYSSLFSGVGLLKGYELKLHVDDTVKPVAQHVRRIPSGLREKVDKKLDELLELDIIEDVPEGPSG